LEPGLVIKKVVSCSLKKKKEEKEEEIELLHAGLGHVQPTDGWSSAEPRFYHIDK
jgi:hypothetical protein